MENFKIFWKKSAEKDLLAINQKNILRIINSIESLASNPYPNNSQKIHGTKHIYRIRVGYYRIIYLIDSDQNSIIIYYIRHRKDVYRKIK